MVELSSAQEAELRDVLARLAVLGMRKKQVDAIVKAEGKNKTEADEDRLLELKQSVVVQASEKGYAQDGRGLYQSDFPIGTPKKAKAAKILEYIHNVWSKKPIPLKVWAGGKVRMIFAQYDPMYSEDENSRTDASKLMIGNKHGTAKDKRVTLDLASDYYKIASEAICNYSKDEIGKNSVTHNGVKRWHYFVNGIYFSEYGEENYEPYMVSVNVKERDDGTYVYSFSAEKEKRLTTQQTLHAAVNAFGDKDANGNPQHYATTNEGETQAKLSEKADLSGLTDEQKQNANDVIRRLSETAVGMRLGIGNIGYASKRIECELSVLPASKDYANAYIAWVSPDDFVFATATFEGRKKLETETKELDIEKLKNELQPITLWVDLDKGTIEGNEGRHRMIALQNAGYDRAPVIVRSVQSVDGAYISKPLKNAQPIRHQKFAGQKYEHGSGTGFYMHNIHNVTGSRKGRVINERDKRKRDVGKRTNSPVREIRGRGLYNLRSSGNANGEASGTTDTEYQKNGGRGGNESADAAVHLSEDAVKNSEKTGDELSDADRLAQAFDDSASTEVEKAALNKYISQNPKMTNQKPLQIKDFLEMQGFFNGGDEGSRPALRSGPGRGS